MRPPSPSIPEKEFVVEALKQGLRLDGRAALEMRQPTLRFGPDLGWVDCSLGKTRQEVLSRPLRDVLTTYIKRVLAQVEGKMVKPPPERPFEGQITIQSEISPMASSEYEQGR